MPPEAATPAPTAATPAAPPASPPPAAPATATPPATSAAVSASPTEAKPAAAVSSEAPKTAEAEKPTSVAAAAESGEKKPEAAKPAEAPKEGEKPAAPAVPEKYEFKFPDGVKADDKEVAAYSEFAKKSGWSQEVAQQALDMHIQRMQTQTKAILDNWTNMQSEWTKNIGSDKEIGNGSNGLKPEAAQQLARAIDVLPPALGAEFRKALDFTGAGNNPAVVKGLHFLGSFFREGKPVSGSPAGNAPKRAADVFYGGSKGKAA